MVLPLQCYHKQKEPFRRTWCGLTEKSPGSCVPRHVRGGQPTRPLQSTATAFELAAVSGHLLLLSGGRAHLRITVQACTTQLASASGCTTSRTDSNSTGHGRSTTPTLTPGHCRIETRTESSGSTCPFKRS